MDTEFDPSLLNPIKQLEALDRADCEESLYYFLVNAWKYIDASPWKDGWPIEAVAEHLQAVVDGETRRLIINIPPRMGKSTITSVAFPAWTWAQEHRSPTSGPGVQFLCASYANQLVLRDSVKCRRLIESPWYQKLWGERFKINSDQNTKSRFSNDQGGERLITSVGAAVTGEGGSCFPGWINVSTPFGDVPISKVSVGDTVLSFDHSRGKVVEKRVLATRLLESDTLYKIRTVSGISVECTGDHPIFVQGTGYVPACELGIGNKIIILAPASSWQNDVICSIERYSGSKNKVYDIQVEECHNFFANGVLAHNCIIVDDPNSASEAFSEATIESTIEWWDGTMSTRLNDQKTGAMIVIQQRLAENDLTGHILEREAAGWTHLCLPMRYEPDRAFKNSIGWEDPREKEGDLLWPDRFGDEEVTRLERALGPFMAAGQLQQRPEPAGGGIIKRDWWKLWPDSTFPPMDYIVASLDTAYTSKTSNDPSAMTIWGIFTTDASAVAHRTIGADGRPQYIDRAYNESAPKVMMMHAWTERLEFHDLVEKVAKTCKALKVDKLLIENKASGISVAQEMRRLYGNEGFAVQLSDPKSLDKMARLYSVQHLFSEGMIYAPDKKWTEEVITQVGQFPKGRFDDLVDTVSMAIRHLRDIGLLTRSAERIQEIENMKTYPNKQETPLYPV